MRDHPAVRLMLESQEHINSLHNRIIMKYSDELHQAAEETKALAEAVLANKPIELLDSGGQWITSQPQLTAPKHVWRIKPLEFPALPEGQEWHNPEGVIAEEVGADFRLVTKLERKGPTPPAAQFWNVDEWNENECLWDYDDEEKYTFRVPADTPFALPPAPPVWTLPTPPKGRQWHRQDWTQEHLPDGFRPLLKGERIQNGDALNYQHHGAYGWTTINSDPAEEGHCVDEFPSYFYRTTRPIPPEPPVMVPLGPEDVKPGAVLRSNRQMKGDKWIAILQVTDLGVFIHSTPLNTWEDIRVWAEISHDGGKTWTACEKPAPQA